MLAQSQAIEQLRDEIGRSFVRAHLQDGENVGMVQCRSGTRFLLETAQAVRIRRKRAGQHFNRDIPMQTQVASAIHFPHATCPNLRLHFVVAQTRAFRKRNPHCRRRQKIRTCSFRRVEQRLHFPPERMIRRTSLLQKRRPLLGSQFQRSVQDLLHLLPALWCHTEIALLISWCSHTLAVAHSLFTVLGEIPSTVAVSSVERPPKKRSSTMRLCLASSFANPFNASSSATRSTLFVLSRPMLSSSVSMCPASRFAAFRRRAYSTRICRMS